MQTKPLALFALAVGLLMVSATIYAHHGTASYETTSSTLKGTVTDFRFINPHSEIFFDVKDDKGNVEKWIAEAGNVPGMSRQGWNRNTLKAGDQITVTGNRAKSGATTIRLRKIVLPDGKEFDSMRPGDYVN